VHAQFTSTSGSEVLGDNFYVINVSCSARTQYTVDRPRPGRGEVSLALRPDSQALR